MTLVPRLVEFLARHDQPALQYEASWALTNIASGSPDHTRHVVEAGAVPRLRDLILCPNDDVREQAVWGLSNIAGDSAQCRDIVLTHGVLDPLLQNLFEASRISMLRNAAWAMSNLCRGKPAPAWGLVSGALPVLARLLHSTDDDVLANACWTISYMSDGLGDRQTEIINAGVTHRLAALLLHPSTKIQGPVLRIIGNLVAGEDHAQTQFAINAGILPGLATLLASTKTAVCKDTCWVISNLTAGDRAHLQAVIDAQIVPRLIHALRTRDYVIKKEATWALSNATAIGTAEQVRYLVSEGLVEPILDQLTSSEVALVQIALTAVENLLKVGERDARETGRNEYAELVESLGGIDRLDALQAHENVDVYNKARNILVVYYDGINDDGDDYGVGAAGDSFQFGGGGGGEEDSGFRF